MATNDVLDRLENWLDKTKSGPLLHSDGRMSAWDMDTYRALRNAAPALIRLARAVLAVDNWTTKTDYEMKLACNEKIDAIKALGEVRL